MRSSVMLSHRPQIALSGRDHGEGASSAATAPASISISRLLLSSSRPAVAGDLSSEDCESGLLAGSGIAPGTQGLRDSRGKDELWRPFWELLYLSTLRRLLSLCGEPGGECVGNHHGVADADSLLPGSLDNNVS
mmetsp:Transcript_59872/g.140015  ORF Transcript_59872/g.140015 Transcript_59872/m.140015 type:complete len:134 (-) Transcript_59872:250-651(-)